jgi:hypothetical protein
MFRVALVENTTENITALADVIATITFRAHNLPSGLLCYVEWENENGNGETPAAKVGRNGTIVFAPIEAKVPCCFRIVRFDLLSLYDLNFESVFTSIDFQLCSS